MTDHPRIGVAALVIRDGKLLLGERIGAHGVGTWASPGGHLEYGESPQECATRELFEETGLEAKGVIASVWTNDLFEHEQKHYVTLFMVVRDFEGELKVMEPEKCLQWQWFAFNELPEALFLPLRNLFEACPLSLFSARYLDGVVV